MVILESQIIKLKKVIPGIEDLVRANNFEEIQSMLDFAIVDALDQDYNSTTKSRELQKLYDEIYEQN